MIFLVDNERHMLLLLLRFHLNSNTDNSKLCHKFWNNNFKLLMLSKGSFTIVPTYCVSTLSGVDSSYIKYEVISINSFSTFGF